MIRINRFALSIAFTLLTFSIGIAAYSFPGAFSTSVKASASDAKQSYDYDTIHALNASYFSVKDDWSATLTLNNKGPKPIEVALTLFSLSGARFEAQPMSVKGVSFRVVDLREIVAQAGSLFNEGSLQITYKGKDLELGAQVKLINENRSLIFDEQLAYPAAMSASTKLEGVWWLPSRKSELRFVVSNTTDSVLPINVSVDGVAPKQKEPASLTLGPRETRVLDILQDLVGKNGGALKELGGISIRHSGAKGALLARGLIQEPTRGYSAVIQFIDPGKSKSTKLQGAGLRLGQNLRPVIVARNIGESVTTITGRAPYTSSVGAASAVEFPALRLGPGEIGIINTSAILRRGQVDSNVSAGLEFEYEGSPGSVLISALTISQDGNQVFRIPISDPDSHRSSTGGYPWFIEGDSSTVVYIKNVTDRPQRFRLDLDFADGAYALGLKTIEAHQTMTIDVRSLRNLQTQDINKRVIPSEVNRGQIRWSFYGPENLTLIGRAEQADVSKGLSSTYACENCCGDSYNSGWLAPGSVIGPVGGITQFLAIEQNVNCYGQISEPFSVSPDIWGSSNSAVANVVNSGEATCLSPGSAYISATWTAYKWETEFLDERILCKVEEVVGSGDSPVTVVRVTFQKSDGSALPAPHRVGVSSVNFDRKQSLRAVVEPSLVAADVTIESSGKLDISNVSRSGNIITFNVVGKENTHSENKGDQHIRARYSPNGINFDHPVTVVVPWQIGIPHDTVGGGIVIQNRALNVTTSPGQVNIPANQFELYTVYMRNLTVTVQDKWGDTIGEQELYRGSTIYEELLGTWFSINQTLTAASTYTDPVGGALVKQTEPSIVPATNTAAINSWLSAPTQPMIAGSATQNIPVRVDTFILRTGVVNRTWTATPPSTVTITWP